MTTRTIVIALLAISSAWLLTEALKETGAFELENVEPTAISTAAPNDTNRILFAIPEDLSELADTRFPRLAHLSDNEIAALADRLGALPVPARVAIFGFLQVGTPYVGGALGEETPPDTDPLVRFDVTDCTIFNLMNASLAHTSLAFPLRDQMVLAGYRGGDVRFESRLHFTADRLDESPFFRDISKTIPSALSTDVVLNRKPDGSRWIDIPWEKRRSLVYVPADSAAAYQDYAEVLGVAFVKLSFAEKGLDVLHEGLLYRGEVLLHASSKHGRVLVEPFDEFVRRYDGVVVFEYL